MKKPKILMFTPGDATAEDKAQAKAIGAMLRDASAWHEGDAREVCDFVCGTVPAQYAGVPVFQEAPKAPAKDADTEDAPKAPAKDADTEDAPKAPAKDADTEDAPKKRGRPRKEAAEV